MTVAPPHLTRFVATVGYEMSYILCATRGGQGSRALRQAAIALARETGQSLLFLYVADLSAYDTGEKSLKEALLSESRWLGRALLAIARRQGLVAGVEVESIMRDGDIQEQIQAVVEEKDVSVIMLGAPRGTTTNIFGDDAIEQLALELEERTSVPVEIVRP